jgi:glutamate synthase (NADPH/NADH) small chain
MSQAKKTAVPRQTMAEQKRAERISNFREVPFGFTPEQARAEADRCLQCKNAPCRKGCPVEVDIPAFIREITAGQTAAAARTLKATNSLPAVCGRVCPQEDQCEKLCVLGKLSSPVAIGALERFAADHDTVAGGDVGRLCEAAGAPDRRSGLQSADARESHKVAVIGAGPAGLTAAADLARMGHRVVLFEALHEAGGVLVYGIPEFRLPKEIVAREVENVRKLGVDLRLDQVVGRTVAIDDLIKEGFRAIFIATGAGLPSFMSIPGENLVGVYSANEYLTRVNLMKAFRFPEFDTPVARGKRVCVVGGGNVAMDSARTALRLGAEKVSIIYRRTRDEMPARKDEIVHAEEEGVVFRYLTLPVRYLDDGKGRLRGMECLGMKLGEPDESGRRRPLPVRGSEFTLDCDLAVVAIGNDPNPLLVRAIPGLKLGRKGNVEIDPETGRTSLPGIFAGGDIATGAATVIEAMGAGKRAARAIDAFLKTVTEEKVISDQ